MGNSHVSESQITSRAGRNKVKSGCRTCKLRRVKCDESWPVCCRCVSTGRVCEGYGVWGGGGNQYGRRPDRPRSLGGVYAPALISGASSDESRSLEWFTYRTALKLPGAFRFGFWDTLIFQAVSKERAVLHAVLALSSAHKREGLYIDTSAADYIPDEQQQFTLRHYSKAISHLQPHFTSQDNSSIRVALVTCLLFVLTEYFRGHYRTSNAHLQSGIKLLNEFHARSSAIDCYSLFEEPCANSVDAWIIQSFIRLDVQAKLLGQGSQYLDFMLEDNASKFLRSGLIFQSINQARQYLDRIFNYILYLNHECRTQLKPDEPSYPSIFLAKQQDIRDGLALWYQAYKLSKTNLKIKGVTPNAIGYVILHLYYTMAVIMADNCLWPADELGYDKHADSFVSMMKQLNYVRNLSASPFLVGITHYSDMSNSIIDLGGLPPVYYVALKCRARRVRHDALEFLDPLEHKEGVWNAPMAACIARDVVKMEEDGFYQDNEVADGCECNGAGKKKKMMNNKSDIVEPTLPASHRLRDVQVELPADYAGIVTLRCRRRRGSSDWQAVTRQYRYDERSRTWIGKERA
ncbi:hypothetical protein GGR53DRAFT_466930 [Hypoxylon sp. FL1150]|nr:hypothetical protein GGR53DRAFT_466930 [Hypoxylon sp. FL1150]